MTLTYSLDISLIINIGSLLCQFLYWTQHNRYPGISLTIYIYRLYIIRFRVGTIFYKLIYRLIHGIVIIYFTIMHFANETFFLYKSSYFILCIYFLKSMSLNFNERIITICIIRDDPNTYGLMYLRF